uniref:Putative secreted protein n=1 Tax=Ixodes ricinus TaxID=34613 RepID=A0A6B0U0C7_IXORI
MLAFLFLLDKLNILLLVFFSNPVAKKIIIKGGPIHRPTSFTSLATQRSYAAKRAQTICSSRNKKNTSAQAHFQMMGRCIHSRRL